ncbi:TonB-dependent receptor [Campylobacter blaseri]|uniref:Ligand-gated channel protein n=1 Tax=Campylobacter blaseri TaxID=2042961 RepID=A0A2P8R412_9BACT|nr:TonB-dependent hemoglobin/transferrin/lactoferrin family receptor [Campylobacter blaseri]PSM53236.1 ligand-gated channel protein [Campylobacter blaseri]PSM54702.1 ligand-gated channel protein [Campylobacter blaseri]QKF86815.1 TonB-dependent receptor [Campylobacter blaseri]
MKRYFYLIFVVSVSNFLLNAKEISLNQVTVTASEEDNLAYKKVGKNIKSSKKLSKEQVSSSKDLVRYETGISIVEGDGRFGSSGYNIRGAEENRVATVIDGLHQAQTLSSQSFKELFMGYGNFNNVQNGVEMETLKQVTFQKGSNSVKTGNGSLGGSVIFETKDARDYLLEKDWFFSVKSGYSSANSQKLFSTTLAAKVKYFDFLFVKAKRDGHETKNYGYKGYDDSIVGKKREKADPYNISYDSTLVKVSFNPSENHRFTIGTDMYEKNSQGNDYSYTLTLTRWGNSFQELGKRYTDDKVERKNNFLTYENYDITPFWDTLKLTFSNQKIKTKAKTDENCRGNNCIEVSNKEGIDLKNGQLVDKYGGKYKAELNSEGKELYVDSKGNKILFSNADLTSKRLNQLWFDCSVFDCSKEIEGYKTGYDTTGKTIVHKKFKLDREATWAVNGKTYRSIPDEYGWLLMLPNSKGYLERDWKDRDLNTDTKQINLDLTKSFTTFNLDHYLEYGGLYSKTEKSMVNRQGYDGANAKWWGKYILEGNTPWNKPNQIENVKNSYLNPKIDPEFSFLIPVEIKNTALYFYDELYINDKISFDLGYRYDILRYRTKYEHGKSPKIPDDTVKGLFIPMPKGEEIWWNPGHYYPPNDKQIAENIRQNIDFISKPKKYNSHSYELGLNLDPLDYLKIQLKYSKGFRAPTSDELYFTFQHPDFTIIPNPTLEAETSKTKEISFTLHNENYGYFSINAFRTDYDNFIDLVFLGAKNVEWAGGSRVDYYKYANFNRDNAKVEGIEIESKLNLGALTNILDGFHIGYKLTKQKGTVKDKIDMPMNAINPMKSVYNLGYNDPLNKYGIDLYMTSVAKKKAKDTYNMFWKEQGETDTTMKYRSDDYTVVDLIGYIKPIKNLTIRGGIYNITDKKYLTWESARSIRPFGTTNLIDQDTGEGLARFYSPGRNFKIDFEYKF